VEEREVFTWSKAGGKGEESAYAALTSYSLEDIPVPGGVRVCPNDQGPGINGASSKQGMRKGNKTVWGVPQEKFLFAGESNTLSHSRGEGSWDQCWENSDRSEGLDAKELGMSESEENLGGVLRGGGFQFLHLVQVEEGKGGG